MSFSPAAHDPSVAEDGDTSPTELGRKKKERPYANTLLIHPGCLRRRRDLGEHGLERDGPAVAVKQWTT